MHLWIGVHLPLLALEAFRPRWSEPGRHVVVDREQVLAASHLARADGVRAGMRRGGVLALCPQAMLHERDPAREQAALDSVALSLLQYTPELALAEEASLLLDIGASLRAFGGARALARRVRASVLALGFTPRLSMAPTAQGAWLLARCPPHKHLPRRRRVLRMTMLAACLDRLPCALPLAARRFEEWFAGIGCRSLGELRRLPRAGLRRRCGEALLTSLDRAYGQAPELFDWVQAPASFGARLELPDRIEHAEAMLFAARRLIMQMTGWLVAQHLAVTRFLLTLEHERGRHALPPTLLEIALAEAAWQEAHLVRLVKERLARMVLTAPAIALRLDAVQMEALAPPTDSLFSEPGGTPADHRRLLELLTARLGNDAVLRPAPLADHRPEVSNRWLPAGAGEQAGKIQGVRPSHAAPATHSASAASTGERPFWLFETPVELKVRDHRPYHGGPLHMPGVAERIECGWWDGGLVQRDYFVAQDAAGACYWIYRERIGIDIRWYLHGLFA